MGATKDEILEVSDLADKLWETRRDSLKGTPYEGQAAEPPNRDQRSLYLDLALFVLENYRRKGAEAVEPTEVEDGDEDRWFRTDNGYWSMNPKNPDASYTLHEIAEDFGGYKVIR